MKQNTSNTSPIIEVLISTINRTSLAFIDNMFPDFDLKDLNLLVINQTISGNECVSKFENIRVINSYEIGLSRSRNLAIKNAIGAICLIADDDVEYVKDFQEIVINSYNLKTNASVILFKIDTFTGEDYKAYPEASKRLLTRNSIKPASSIEISFKREHIINKNIEFNTLFGLGSHFTSGEEYLFLKDVLNKKLNVYFENKIIVKHAFERSTSNMANDNYVATVSAINYIDFKGFSYLLLLKYLFYLLRHKLIGFKDVFTKFRVGIKAIAKCKKLTKML